MACETQSKRTFYITVTCGAILLSALLAVSPTVLAQSQRVGVSEMSESEQHEFLLQSLNSGLFAERIDQIGLLTLNRSDMVIPELLRRARAAVADSAAISERDLLLITGMIAYAGNERAVEAISELVELDEQRFGPFIARTFDYAVGKRNPYSLAYYAFRTSKPAVERHVIKWVEARSAFPSNRRQWAETLYERYKKVPSDAELLADPIVSRLPANLSAGVRKELRERVSAVMATQESQRK